MIFNKRIRYQLIRLVLKVLRFSRVRQVVAVALCFFGFVYAVMYIKNQQYHKAEEIHTKHILNVVKADTSRLVLPEISTTILQPPFSNMCKENGSKHYLLFMFITAPENHIQRSAIRHVNKELIGKWDNWIVDSHPVYQLGESIKTFFFVGISNNNADNIRLKEEAHLYGDVIIDDFKESYLNLTLKTLRMLKWVQSNCAEVSYMIKIDDDVHLHVPKILQFLSNYNKTAGRNLIAGHKYSNKSIDSDPFSKWYTPKFLWTEQLPDFVAGFFYILGFQSRADLYQNSLKTPLFHLEDVFLTGIVRSKFLNVTIVNIPDICVFWLRFASNFDHVQSFQKRIAVHSINAVDLKCYSQFTSPDFEYGFLPFMFAYC